MIKITYAPKKLWEKKQKTIPNYTDTYTCTYYLDVRPYSVLGFKQNSLNIVCFCFYLLCFFLNDETNSIFSKPW